MTISHFRNITIGRYTSNSVMKRGNNLQSYSFNDVNSTLQFAVYGGLYGFPVDHQVSHSSQFKKCYMGSKINTM